MADFGWPETNLGNESSRLGKKSMRMQTENTEMHGVARAASLVAVGNIVSRILGLVRESVKSSYFGSTGYVSAFNLATKIPMMFYDLLVGGMVSSALVPVFSEYAVNERDRSQLWQVASFLLTLSVVVLAALGLLCELFAPALARLIGGNLPPDLLALTTQLLRITVPAIFFLNLAGILTALLYSLKRFALPAFNSAIFNLAIVVATLLLATRLGIHALAWGLLAGAMAQVLLQLPGLRSAELRPLFDWHHPALRKIGKLYLPILVGLVIDIFSRTLSYNLASGTGERSVAYMDYATTLMQFPLGLTSVAVAAAILPTLARQAVESVYSGKNQQFLQTLAGGLKLVLLLIIPATVGIAVLARPIVQLVFEHGLFTADNTTVTVQVLLFYLVGVIPAALDLLLVNAFYARQDPLTPALVGLASVLFYLAVALGLGWVLHRPMQLTDLMIANAAQLIAHALLMWRLLVRRVGSLNGQDILPTLLKAISAAIPMGLGAYFLAAGLAQLQLANGLLGEVLRVAIPGAVGGTCYFAILALWRVPELELLLRRFRRPTA
jgi:putative peptidoglycan lipid II flippase